LKSLSISGGGKKFFTLISGATYKFQKDSIKRDWKINNFPKIIKRASNTFIFLYDVIKNWGWLIPKLFVLCTIAFIYI